MCALIMASSAKSIRPIAHAIFCADMPESAKMILLRDTHAIDMRRSSPAATRAPLFAHYTAIMPVFITRTPAHLFEKKKLKMIRLRCGASARRAECADGGAAMRQ